MQKEQQYLELLKIFLEIVEASKDIPPGEDNRILDAEGLALKFYSHACSFLHLFRSTKVPELKIDFFDVGSINVIGRAILESFLVFHYIFIDSENIDQQTFRYQCWQYYDLMEQQSFPVQSPQGMQKMASIRNMIDELKTKIESNLNYNSLTQKQKNKLIAGKNWRFKGWKEIALSAGLSNVHADSFYAYLCSYAHAGSLSVLQQRQAFSANDQQSLVGATMGMAMISLAYMAKDYCLYFPKSNNVLNANEEYMALIQVWFNIGASNLDNTEINWEEING